MKELMALAAGLFGDTELARSSQRVCDPFHIAGSQTLFALDAASAQRWRSRYLMSSNEAFAYARSTELIFTQWQRQSSE
jgi:hypothetical protein